MHSSGAGLKFRYSRVLFVSFNLIKRLLEIDW